MATWSSSAAAQSPFEHDYSVHRIAENLLVPLQMDFDANGDLYLGSGHIDGNNKVHIWRVRPDGTTETFGQKVFDPDALQIGPDGAIYIGAFGGRISRMDPGDGQYSTWLANPALGNIDGLEWDGNDLYVVAFDKTTVYRIDFSTKNVTLLADLSSIGFTHLTGIVVDPFQARLFVGAPIEGTIAELDLAGNVLNPTFATGLTFPGHLNFDPSGKHGTDLFCADNGGANVSRIDSTTGQVFRYIDGLDPLTGGLAFDDQGRLYASKVTNAGDIGEIWRTEPLTLSVEGDLRGGPFATPAYVRIECLADAGFKGALLASLDDTGVVLPTGRLFPVGPGTVTLLRTLELDVEGKAHYELPTIFQSKVLRGTDVYLAWAGQTPSPERTFMGISSAYTLSIPPNQPPIAVAGSDQRGRTGFELSFDGGASHDDDLDQLDLRWDMGDGVGEREGAQVEYAFTAAGSYVVTLTADDGLDQDDDTLSVTIADNTPPVADAGPDQEQRTGFPVTLDGTASSDGDGDTLSYRWDPGDGSGEKSGDVVVHTYTTAGTFVATLTVDDGYEAASDVATITVTDNNVPTASAGPDQDAKTNFDVVLDGTGSSDEDGDTLTYTWDFGDGSPTDSGSVVVHQYTAAGTFVVTLTVDDGYDTAFDTATITVTDNTAPVAEAGSDLDGRTTFDVTLDGTGSFDADGDVLGYEWDFGDGSPLESGDVVTHAYALPGTYVVTLTVDDGHEMDVDTCTVSVTDNNAPVADAGADQNGKTGVEVFFDGGGSSDADFDSLTYEWDFGDGSGTEFGLNVSHTYTAAGDFTVTLTVFDGYETGLDTATVSVIDNHPPVADAGPDLNATTDWPTQFDGTGSSDPDGDTLTYSWDFGDGVGSDTGESPVYTYDTAGSYTVTLTVDDGCVTDQDTLVVTVTDNTAPVAEAGSDQSGIVDEVLDFDGSNSTDADGDTLRYTWDFGDGSSTETGVSVSHSYSSTGTFTVILTVDDGCDTDVDTLTVTIH